ncbi:hypothetical protein BH23GEM8_BH23GEM8_07110 [soil metagenome]
MRRTDHVAGTMTGKKALILGVGALGSSIAMLLAKAGVHSLQLVDRDRIRSTNAGSGVGNPSTRPGLPSDDCRRELGSGCAGSVDSRGGCGGGRHGSRDVQSARERGRGSRGQTSGLHFHRRRASVGEALIVRPGSDPCVVCHTALARDPDYPVVLPGEEGAFIEAGCGAPTVQASAADVESTATMAARVALRLLQGRAGDYNHLLLVNDPLPEATGVLASEGLYRFRWSRAGCSVCGATAP